VAQLTKLALVRHRITLPGKFFHFISIMPLARWLV